MADKSYLPQAGVSTSDLLDQPTSTTGQGALGPENSVMQDQMKTALGCFLPIFYVPPEFQTPTCKNANDKYSKQEIAALTMATQTMNADQLQKGQNAVLSTDMMLNLFDAEDERRTFWGDDVGEFLGVASSYGHGQLTEAMMQDVVKNCGPQMEQFIASWNEQNPDNPISTPDLKNWKSLAEDEVWGAFFSTAGLQMKIDSSEKEGRSQEDATRFGIGKYHGGFNMLSEAQKSVDDTTNWSPVEDALKNGTDEQKDMVHYIDQVMQPRSPIECTGGPATLV